MLHTTQNQFVGEMVLIPMEEYEKMKDLNNELIKYRDDLNGCIKLDLFYGRKLYLTKEGLKNDIQKEIDKSTRLFRAYKKEIDKLSKMNIFKFFLWKKAYSYTSIMPLKENEI